jgi:thiol-disulfide isomerase/thioredoxin
MRFFFLTLALMTTLSGAVSEKVVAESAALEQEIKGIVAGSHVTVVHFWAPWCSNCAEEMRPDGWPKFVNANTDVKVVFLSVWHQGQSGDRKLETAGLTKQENFIARTHPNPSSTREEKLNQFLGFPLGWVPSTWVFRDGKLRYALNHGEVRFAMLQQMVMDASRDW